MTKWRQIFNVLSSCGVNEDIGGIGHGQMLLPGVSPGYVIAQQGHSPMTGTARFQWSEAGSIIKQSFMFQRA